MKLLKKVSKIIILIIICNFIMTLNLVDAAETIAVEFEGNVIEYNEKYGYPFIDQNNRTQVPFRLTLETMEVTVSYDQEKREAIAIKGNITVEVPIGTDYIIKNGVKIQNDTTSKIINGRTYLPIRVVLEAFEYNVEWDNDERKVIVYEQDQFISIPRKFDLREQNKVPIAQDQENTGACWSFASLEAVQTNLLPKEKYDFSEDHLSLNHGFNLLQNDGGNYKISLAYLARWAGPVLEEEDPFNDGKTNLNAKVVKHVQSAMFIPNKDLTGIKLAIMKNVGVQTSLYLNSYTLNPDNNYYNEETTSYYYYGPAEINHDVLIIGWDDEYSKENFKNQPSEDGAFIALNSYGTDFGDDGYFYISYEDTNIGKRNVAYTRVDNIDNYDNIYQSDKLGYISSMGYNLDTAYFSNVYTTPKKEKVRAISFYALGLETSYEIYIVKNFNDTNDFLNMEFLQRGTFDYGGYYTVDLNKAQDVEGKFAVVVKIKTPGVNNPVAAESTIDTKGFDTVDITDGEGYISFNGESWDNTEEQTKSNICLKVFTDNTEIEEIIEKPSEETEKNNEEIVETREVIDENR